MKITDIKAYVLKTEFTPEWPLIDLQTTPLHYYDEYNGTPVRHSQSVHLDPEAGFAKNIMIEIMTDEGISGIHIPVNQFMQVEGVLKIFRPFLIGMNPLEIRTIRDKCDRYAQYARTGVWMASIAAIDNALWDLQGKVAGLPTFRLLGGGRTRIQPYISTLGCVTEDLSQVKEWAVKVKEMGVWGQKWFFKYGPGSGNEGIDKNLALAHTVREAVGADTNIMFDAWASWDLTYCLDMFKRLEEVNPYFIEEPLRADRIEAFKMLKDKTDIKIATGEKLLNRFELHEFLKQNVIDFYQPEPEMFGGISETKFVGELCELYGVKFAPHGMSLMPILSVTAAMAPDISPCFEYLMRTVPGFISPLKNPPQIVDGYVQLDERPGLYTIDESKIVQKTEIVI
ncbi:MAG: hypothetical protein FWG21_01020 [Oscillospiraceae bacterium]|nr:hypothetical protein [Oscillospiraceae bacterium]